MTRATDDEQMNFKSKDGNAFLDYFRCPNAMAKLSSTLDLRSQQGYFKFGPENVCFGRSSTEVSKRATTALETDASIAVDNGMVRLPFDLSEVVENLRRERYLGVEASSRKLTELSSIRKIYYAVRPLLPVALRKHLQRVHLADWKEIAFPHWPVDSTVDRVFDKVMRLLLHARGGHRIPFIWFWPDGHSACTLVTHDVEHEPGYNFCDTLMDINDEFGMKAAFQLVPESRYVVESAQRERMASRGFEVNVHDLNHDGELFLDHALFLKRAAKINQYGKDFGALGFRAGAMYRNLEWMRHLKFDYDMSVPSAAHLEPQRGGCCTVMPFWNGNMVELPLTTTQDYTLFHILGYYSTELWNSEIDYLLRSHGLISFIIHPDYIIEERPQKIYRELLKRLAQLREQGQIWLTLPREAAKWWRLRGQMRLERDDDHWRIIGEGSERAQLAWAELDGDRLVYRLDHKQLERVHGAMSLPVLPNGGSA